MFVQMLKVMLVLFGAGIDKKDAFNEGIAKVYANWDLIDEALECLDWIRQFK